MASDVEIRNLQYVLATHLRNRRIAIGSIPAGIALFVLTLGSPAMVLGIVAALAGPVLAFVASSYVRDARRALRGETVRRRLPTARLV